jgi:integrase
VDPNEWTPRELRRSFVSLLLDNGIPLGEISRRVGHSSTAVTFKRPALGTIWGPYGDHMGTTRYAHDRTIRM